MKKKINPMMVVGYTLEACYLARQSANQGIRVEFVQTGKLGCPLDDINDYILSNDVAKLKAIDPTYEFTCHINTTYLHIPYDQLKFVNTRNGLVTWPMCESSFESAEEWEEMLEFLSSVPDFYSELDDSNNHVGIYRRSFPRWFYDSVIKHISVNKWGGIRQSKFSKDGIKREIDLSSLDGLTSPQYYSPNGGYGVLCNKLLQHENIKITKLNIKSVRSYMDKANRTTEVMFCDNRVDLVYDFVYGEFTRVKWWTTDVNETDYDELIDVTNGVVLTPMKDYWCIWNNYGKTRTVHSEIVDSHSTPQETVLAPLYTNKKLLMDYMEFMFLQRGKKLCLEREFSTFVR